MLPHRFWRALALPLNRLPFAAVLLAGCGQEGDPTFARVERRTEVVTTFQRETIQGKERREFYATLRSDVQHQEFLVNWTNLNREITVELYVLRRQDYEENQAMQNPKPPMGLAQELTDLQNAERMEAEQNEQPMPPMRILWPELPIEGPPFGDRLPTQLHLHPDHGDWVLFFYNPLDRSPTNRALLSATIELSYFSLN